MEENFALSQITKDLMKLISRFDDAMTEFHRLESFFVKDKNDNTANDAYNAILRKIDKLLIESIYTDIQEAKQPA
jgi:hypothetical protein